MKATRPLSRSLHRAPAALSPLCAGCGVIHLLVATTEGGEWVVSGLTLGAVGIVQVLLAGALLLGLRWARTLAGWFSLAVAALWVMSTSSGLPAGPHAWVPEPVTAPGIAATALELLLALGVFALSAEPVWGRATAAAAAPLLPPPPPPPPPAWGPALAGTTPQAGAV